MAKYNNTKFYWLQLKEDFFEDDAIQWLEEQEPNGRDYAYFYLKLCLKSLKSNGVLIRKVGNILIPYDNKKLSELTKMDFDTVTVAMELLKRIGLVKILENGEIYIEQLQNLIGSKSIGAFKKQQQIARRESEKAKIKNESKLLLETTIYENGLPVLNKVKRLTREQLLLPNGKVVFVDEKRYGGNGGLAYERANGVCEECGSDEKLLIHHENGFSNNLEDLIVLCSKCHGVHHSKKYKGGEEVENFPPKIDIDIEIDKELDIEEEININNDDTNIPLPKSDEEILKTEFDKLWKLYPKKVGKDKAFAKYKKYRTSKGDDYTTFDEVMSGLERYLKYIEQNRWYSPKDGSTWFNNKSWNDEYEIKGEKVPEWFDKEIEPVIATEDERNSIERLLQEYR